jgi:hypothetical protein
MCRTACTVPQCLYKGDLYLFSYFILKLKTIRPFETVYLSTQLNIPEEFVLHQHHSMYPRSFKRVSVLMDIEVQSTFQLDPVLTQMNPIHVHIEYMFKNGLILSSRVGLSIPNVPRIPTKIFYALRF